MTIWKFIIAVILAATLVVPSHAGWRRPRAQQEQLLPPIEYRNYKGKYELLRASVKWITLICKELLGPNQLETVACTLNGGDKCIVLIAMDEELDARGWDFEIVLEHEKGHCAGWSHK